MAARRKPTTRRREAITPETMLRVAIYTRRSTDDEHQPYTIEAQTQKLTAYVDSQPGWQITAGSPTTPPAPPSTDPASPKH